MHSPRYHPYHYVTDVTPGASGHRLGTRTGVGVPPPHQLKAFLAATHGFMDNQGIYLTKLPACQQRYD